MSMHRAQETPWGAAYLVRRYEKRHNNRYNIITRRLSLAMGGDRWRAIRHESKYDGSLKMLHPVLQLTTSHRTHILVQTFQDRRLRTRQLPSPVDQAERSPQGSIRATVHLRHPDTRRTPVQCHISIS